MIKRDPNGLIMQVQDDGVTLDGGDTAHKTGIYALCGSVLDQTLLPVFEQYDSSAAPGSRYTGKVRRHPTQAPWNFFGNFSRDQLMAFMAGAYRANHSDLAKRVFVSHAKRFFFCQNSYADSATSARRIPDVLLPHHIWYLAVCARYSWAHLLAPIGAPFLLLDLLVSTKLQPTNEQNQLMCQCIVLGRFWKTAFKVLHKSWRSVTMDYWGGWRGTPEIGTALIAEMER